MLPKLYCNFCGALCENVREITRYRILDGSKYITSYIVTCPHFIDGIEYSGERSLLHARYTVNPTTGSIKDREGYNVGSIYPDIRLSTAR